MSNKSDREVILELQENVYWQAFCGMEGFVRSEQLNSSSLTKKQMLQYVRRNLEQIKDRVLQLDYLIQKEVEKKIELAKRIYEQQFVFHKCFKMKGD